MSRSPQAPTRVATVLAMFTASIVPLCAQSPRERFALTSNLVATTLSQAGFTVDPTQVDMPSGLSANTIEPHLHITTANLLADGRLRVQLACRNTGDCMPFLATIRPSSTPDALAAIAHLQKASEPTTATPHPSSARVLAGQHTTLLMEDQRMRISLATIAIDSGAPGSEVRVSSLDRKQTFRAVVVDSGTVRANLP